MWFSSKVLKKVESIIQISEWITIIIIIHHQEMGCLQCTQYPFIHCDNVCSSMNYQHINHYCGFLWQSSTEKDGDSGELNDKVGYRTGTVSSFQTSPSSVICMQHSDDPILVWRLRQNARHLLVFDICIEALHMVCQDRN